jgi:hypothetical protein
MKRRRPSEPPAEEEEEEEIEAVSSRFLLETSDLQLRACSRTVAEGAPPGTWWARTFGANASHPALPIRLNEGLPVYSVEMPAVVLDAILDILRLPNLRSTAPFSLPPSLKKLISLAAWREYLVYNGLLDPKLALELGKDDEFDDYTERKNYLRKHNLDNLFRRLVVKYGKDLAAHIRQNHPNFQRFVNGRYRMIECDFHAIHAEGGIDLARSSCLEFPESGDAYNDCIQHFLRYCSEAHRAVVSREIESILPAGILVTQRSSLLRASQSTSAYRSLSWPASPDDVTPVIFEANTASLWTIKLEWL